MSTHQPILPAQAIALVQARNLDSAETLLADFAAAGLIKTYALMREIRPEGGPSIAYRDSQIPAEEWDRIVMSNSVEDALNGGTVRLPGASVKGGQPSVQITGVSFSKTSLEKLLDRYCTGSSKDEGRVSSSVRAIDPPAAAGSVLSNAPPIKRGARLATIPQVMAETGLGRSKVNQLMKAGTLERRKFGTRAMVTIESLERYTGLTIAE